MCSAEGNVNRLIFSNDARLAIKRNFCRSGNNNPMFCTMMMHLQRQSFSWLYCHSLHLIAISFINGVILPPRTVDFSVLQILTALLKLQICHD